MLDLQIKPGTEADVPIILSFIKALARYEKLSDEVVATEQSLKTSLFGDTSVAEVILGYVDNTPVSFALFFHNYSTFLGQPGIYIEDLFVLPEMRRQGIGHQMFAYVANLARERGCGRLEWSVLDWNQPAKNLYQSLGAHTMEDWRINRLTGNALEELASSFVSIASNGKR